MIRLFLTACLLLTLPARALDFEPLGKGAAYAETEHQGVRYGIVKAEPRTVTFMWQDTHGRAYRSLGAAHDTLKAQGKTALMLMNAGIFTTTNTPAGLWIEQGKSLSPLNLQKGKGNFHIQPNGVFSLAGKKARIETTASYQKRGGTSDYAVQSGPMLITGGNINPRFVKNLSSPYKRNAVCTTRDGTLYFIMTLDYEKEWPSFYRLAEALKSFGCHQALYLDGSISSWYVRGKSGTFHWSNFVGIIAVTESS